MEFINKLLSTVLLIPTIVANLFFPAPTNLNTGSTYQTPEARALFETSIASKISSTDTSFTLTSATDKDGNSLASSTYGFIIDEGSSDEEIILADCTGTACTNATRGLSSSTGTTTVSALKKAHRAGASIKITDAPLLLFTKNVFKGKQNLENILTYDSAPSFTVGSNQLASVLYADNLSFAGAPNGSETAKGIYELATASEAAAGASLGSTAARLALPASIASSTYNGSSSNRVVVTGASNTIDANYISTSSPYAWSGTNTFSATTTMATTTATQIGVGTTTPALSNGISNAGSEYIVGGLGVGVATTSPGNLVVSGLASTTNLIVSGTCTNCAQPSISTNTGSVPVTANTTTTTTTTCPAGKKVGGGGWSGSVAGIQNGPMFDSYPDTTSSWTVKVITPNNTIQSFTITVYAICNP